MTCVCFMGGDKSQPEIEKLANAVKTNYNLKVGWYSGKEVLPKQLYLFDYVKLGRYIEALGGLDSLNTNQRMYKISANETDDITYRFKKQL